MTLTKKVVITIAIAVAAAGAAAAPALADNHATGGGEVARADNHATVTPLDNHAT